MVAATCLRRLLPAQSALTCLKEKQTCLAAALVALIRALYDRSRADRLQRLQSGGPPLTDFI